MLQRLPQAVCIVLLIDVYTVLLIDVYTTVNYVEHKETSRLHYHGNHDI